MADLPKPQRRSRKIAMNAGELDDFLGGSHTCRVATMSPDGPHNTPLWFVWDDGALWLYSIVKSQRWIDLQRDPRIAVVVDAGEQYTELRGAEISGRIAIVGEVPRNGDEHHEDHAQLLALEQRFAAKYLGAGHFVHDGRHAWLKVVPDKIASWDFRKVFGAPAQ